MISKKALTLSIVIPFYNEQHHIRACLESIKNQTIRPSEVVIVDNNSIDNTVAIAKTYDFVKIVSELKQGIVHARNKGFNSTKADLIGRIDADTILPIDWVERVMMFYKKDGNIEKALTGGGYFYNIRLPRFNGWLLSQLAYRVNWLISRHYILWGSNMVLPKTVWHEVRTDACDRQDIHEDVDLAIHTFRRGFAIEYDNKLRVGVKLKRVWSERNQNRAHMKRWPHTFRVHGYKLWWFGSIGNVCLAVFCGPLIFLVEVLSRIFKRRRLSL